MDERHVISDDRILAVRIILGALIIGVIMFTAIVTLPLGALTEPPDGQFIAIVGVVMAVVAYLGALFIPGLLASNYLKQQSDPSPAQFANAWQTQSIVALAMLEAPAFFNVIAVLIEHNWWSLLITGVVVLLMLLRFPTRSQANQWVETQQLNSQ